MIKQKCQWCFVNIKMSESRYEARGNSCSACSARFTRIMGGVRGVKDDKYGRYQACKVREFTTEEKDNMLKDRILQVRWW